jgi:hypothetical protein
MKISYAAVFTVVTAFADLARGQGFKIASMTWLGRGCPSGSVSLSTDPIGKSSVLTFSAFTTELPGNGTKDCSLHYDIRDIPESQRVVFNSATARGYLSLSKESSVYYRTMGYWSSDAMARVSVFFLPPRIRFFCLSGIRATEGRRKNDIREMTREKYERIEELLIIANPSSQSTRNKLVKWQTTSSSWDLSN